MADDRHPRTRAYVQNMVAIRRAVSGEFESAETLFASTRHILAQHPDRRLASFYAHTHTSNAFDMGDAAHVYAMIERNSKRLDELHPGQPDATQWLIRGEMAMLENRFDDAAADFARVVQTDEDSAIAQDGTIYAEILRSVALLRAGKTDAAQQSWQRAAAWISAADAAPAHTPALLAAAHGVLLNHTGEPDAARAAFAQADEELAHSRQRPLSAHWQLRENRDEVRFHLWQAQSLRDAGKIEAARQHARQCLPASRTRLGQRHFFVRALQAIAETP